MSLPLEDFNLQFEDGVLVPVMRSAPDWWGSFLDGGRGMLSVLTMKKEKPQ